MASDITLGLSLDPSGFDSGARKASDGLKRVDTQVVETEKKARQSFGKMGEALKGAFTGEAVRGAVTASIGAIAAGGAAGAAGAVGGGAGGILGGIFGTAFGSKGRVAATVMGVGIGAALGKGVGIGLKGAMEEEAANNALDVALRRLGTTFEANEGPINKFGNAIERSFGRPAEEAKASIQELVTSGLDLNQAFQLQGLVADVAAQKNIDMASAARIVSLASQGSVKPLRDFGIVLESTGDKGKDAKMALAALAGATTGAAQKAADASPWKAMSEAIGAAFQPLGDSLLPLLKEASGTIRDFFIGLDENGSLKGLGEVIAGVARTIVFAGGLVFRVFGSVVDLVKGLWDVAVGVWQSNTIPQLILDPLIVAGGLLVNFLTFLGGQIWNLVTNAIPAFALSVVQMLLAAARDQLTKLPGGAKIASWLGLDAAINATGSMATEREGAARDKFSEGTEGFMSGAGGVIKKSAWGNLAVGGAEALMNAGDGLFGNSANFMDDTVAAGRLARLKGAKSLKPSSLDGAVNQRAISSAAEKKKKKDAKARKRRQAANARSAAQYNKSQGQTIKVQVIGAGGAHQAAVR